MAHDSLSTINPYDSDATCAMGLADFAALDLDPTLAPAPDSILVKIDAADLRALLPIASEDETRYNLCGVFVSLDVVTREITMVATDGHCLARVVRPIPSDDVDCAAFGDVSCILSRKAVENAVKVSGRGKRADPIFVELNRKRAAAILVGQARITDAEVSGTFPDYKQVIPKGEAQATVCAVNLAIVAKFVLLGEVAGGVRGCAGARITMIDALSPVRLDFGNGCTGVVMPMRM